MLRKATLAIAGTLIASATAFAAQPSPVSISDSNPSYSAADAARYTPRPVRLTGAPLWQAPNPAQVSDSMPEMVGGMSHPTMEGARGATFATREATLGGVRGIVQTPASVEDANPSRIRGR